MLLIWDAWQLGVSRAKELETGLSHIQRSAEGQTGIPLGCGGEKNLKSALQPWGDKEGGQ